jgi:F1F0 ATPase subunit 2
MNDVLPMALSLAGGFGTGVVFFGGLWLTVRRLDKMKHPAVVIFLSSIGRVALALVAFWWLSRGGLLPLAIALAGFLAARFVLIKKVRNSAPAEPPLTPDEKKPCT